MFIGRLCNRFCSMYKDFFTFLEKFKENKLRYETFHILAKKNLNGSNFTLLKWKVSPFECKKNSILKTDFHNSLQNREKRMKLLFFSYAEFSDGSLVNCYQYNI